MNFPLFRLLIVERQFNLPLAQFSSVAERRFLVRKIHCLGALILSIASGLALLIAFQPARTVWQRPEMHEAVFFVDHSRLFEFPPLELAEGFQA
jgi:hypothetical protein